MPNTIRLHRVIAAKPEKLYRAFLDSGQPPHRVLPEGRMRAGRG